jgi:hypothetical protein
MLSSTHAALEPNMTTIPCPTTPLAPSQPWLSRHIAAIRAAWRARRAARRLDAEYAEYADLAHLSEATLRDIGAPAWVHECDRSMPLWLLERMRG